MAAKSVLHPEDLSVVVASNLNADILSDLGPALAGSLGLAAGANLNPAKKYPSMFEPVHGSAPDIAGQGVCNPVGAIGSAAQRASLSASVGDRGERGYTKGPGSHHAARPSARGRSCSGDSRSPYRDRLLTETCRCADTERLRLTANAIGKPSHVPPLAHGEASGDVA